MKKQPPPLGKTGRQPNTALALAKALHRYAKMDEPADVFAAVCNDWPHRIAVLVNDYLFYEVDESDPEAAIAHLRREIKKHQAFVAAYGDLKARARKAA